MTNSPAPPPRVGTAAEQRSIAECFARAGFTVSSTAERLPLSALDELEGQKPVGWSREWQAADPLGILIGLFAVGVRTELRALQTFAGDEALQAFFATGLIALADDHRAVNATVQLVPLASGTRELYIACDRRHDASGDPIGTFSDVVFSGHNLGTRQFLSLMPQSRATSALDLCSGTAVIGLGASHCTDRVVAVDITERATAFARFNCWLNNRHNVDVRCGDLFEAVRGETFTRILAHPPYVPSRVNVAVYRDGGETGERLVRQIIAGMAEHLDVGGTFLVLTIGLDTSSRPFEMRAREWLGNAADEFDLIFAMTSHMAPAQFAERLSSRVAVPNAGTYDEWTGLFNSLEVRDVVYGALAGRRFDRAEGQAHTRRVMAEGVGHPDGFEWLWRWLTWLRHARGVDGILRTRPSLAGTTRVDVSHVVRDGHFVPEHHRLKNGGHPFPVEIETDGWIVALVNAFDGQRDAEDVFTALRESGALPDGFTRDDFAELVGLFAEKGILHVADV